MKTTKSIVVVLFLLLTAQIAAAYYCPSAGRWLNRDPMGESGFQTLQVAARMPAGTSGRWINRDPSDDHKGTTPYLFCNNDPNDGIDDLGLSTWSDVLNNWKNIPQDIWNDYCFGIIFNVKSEIQDAKTERINGCKFACCPLPASAIAAIGELVIDHFLNRPYGKKCASGKSCCDIVTQGGEVGHGGVPFTIETGPHAGENGAVTIAGNDVTDVLKEYGGYTPTATAATCRFSGSVHLNGQVYVAIGECKGPH